MKYNSLCPVNDSLSVQRLPIPRGVFARNVDRVESREERRCRCQVKTYCIDYFPTKLVCDVFSLVDGRAVTW